MVQNWPQRLRARTSDAAPACASSSAVLRLTAAHTASICTLLSSCGSSCFGASAPAQQQACCSWLSRSATSGMQHIRLDCRQTSSARQMPANWLASACSARRRATNASTRLLSACACCSSCRSLALLAPASAAAHRLVVVMPAAAAACTSSCCRLVMPGPPLIERRAASSQDCGGTSSDWARSRPQMGRRHFQTGGLVPGALAGEQLITLQASSTVDWNSPHSKPPCCTAHLHPVLLLVDAAPGCSQLHCLSALGTKEGLPASHSPAAAQAQCSDGGGGGRVRAVSAAQEGTPARHPPHLRLLHAPAATGRLLSSTRCRVR